MKQNADFIDTLRKIRLYYATDTHAAKALGVARYTFSTLISHEREGLRAKAPKHLDMLEKIGALKERYE